MTVTRCGWVSADPLYIAYHDEEWGVPNGNSQRLFEKLILEGFQAGLSWITILRKREDFRRAFDGFNAAKMVRYNEAKLAKLMADPGIIRNRLKIEASVSNARAYLKLSERQSFASFLWGFVDGQPVRNGFVSLEQIPPVTPLSERISKALKAEGFRFVGPTTIYAMMQSVGIVNDHIRACHRHEPCSGMLPEID